MKNFIVSIFAFGISFLSWGQNHTDRSNTQLKTAHNLEEKVDWNYTNKQSTYFIENKGQIKQTNGEDATYVRYALERGNTNIYLLESCALAFQFVKLHYPDGYDEVKNNAGENRLDLGKLNTFNDEIITETYRMDMKLLNANPNPIIAANVKSADYFQFYSSNTLDVHHYQKITYYDVYPGIDWVIYTKEDGGFKYDFELKPGADPTNIKMEFLGHEELYIDEDGNLIHGNRLGRFVENAPVSFQETKNISSRFHLEGNIVSYVVDDYDNKMPLTIDPARIWGTYYGGTGEDRGQSCATDSNGNVYMSGFSISSTNIASLGHQNSNFGQFDAFLVKFNSSGVRQWATYYGGTDYDASYSCAVDALGNVYLSGLTGSSNNISSNGHQNSIGGGTDAFLVKFNTDGVRQWATYYGGTDLDHARSCTVDQNGNVYLTGYTNSGNNIAHLGQQNTFGGGQFDAFLVKFNANGVREWATYYGDNEDDRAYSCAVDANNNVFLVGYTESPNNIAFNGHQNVYGGSRDAFIVKFDSFGSRLWATYYGGSGLDNAQSCALDNNNNVFVSGFTNSPNNIAVNGFQNTYGGGQFDAFLIKFNSNGVRQWGSYYGGTGWDESYGCAIDNENNVFLVGYGSSTNLAFNGHQNSNAGSHDAILVKFDNLGNRLWATYYGGNNWEESYSCAFDPNGYIYLSGYTQSASNIATISSHQSTKNLDKDAFLVKFASYFCDVLTSSNKSICTEFSEVWLAHTTFNASGIGSPTGLPPGITATFSSDSIILNGLATQPGTYNYSIPVLGSDCDNVFALGVIHVLENCNFITKWDLSVHAGSGNNQIQFYTNNSTVLNYTWQELSPGNSSGSGTIPTGFGTRTVNGLPSNSVIRLEISPNGMNSFARSWNDRFRLVDIEAWGLVQWNELLLNYCENLNISATDIPNLSNINNLSYLFEDCINLTGPSNINSWDVSSILFMSGLFKGATNFNQPLNDWNVGNVQSIMFMFNNATAFNQDLNNWNLSSATAMWSMFDGASSFNKPLGNWVLNPNANMNNLFNNSGLDCDNYSQTLVGWQQNNPNVLNRTLGALNINHKYEALAAKDTLINARGWTINDSGIGSCEPFETLWNMSQFSMNPDEINFNADITGLGAQFTWEQVPSGASGSGVLTPGNGLKVIDGLPSSGFVKLSIQSANIQRFYMGAGTSTSHLVDVLRWGDVQWTSMENAFYGCNNLQITAPFPPDLSDVTSMKNMFRECQTLNNVPNINSWDVSNVTNMESLFQSAELFNQDISNWNTSNVINMSWLFRHALVFNQNINNWNTSSCTKMSGLFYGAHQFNQPLGNWDVSNVTDLYFTFYEANSFNQNINSWNTSQVTSLWGTFWSASSFNQPLNDWDVSNVTLTIATFMNATSFNQPLNNWDVSNVTNMNAMFWSAITFNQNINSWDVSNVQQMREMFLQAHSFNQPLDQWNTVSVWDMFRMFQSAYSFNQNLGNWTLSSVVNLNDFFNWTSMDCFNYAATLIGWAVNNPTVTGRNLGASGVFLAQNGSYGKNVLTGRGWIFNDSGYNDCGEFTTLWDLGLPGAHQNQIQFNVGFSDSLQFICFLTNPTPPYSSVIPDAFYSSGFFNSQGLQIVSGIPENYQVRVMLRAQNLEHFSINNGPDRHRLTAVEKWGDVAWTSMEGMFYGCNFSQIPASAGTPQTSQVLSTKNMFRNCSNLQTVGDLNSWNMESVTNMESMFHGCANFTENIADWDVSSVNNMKSMFEGASSFNSSLGTWNVGQVQDFSAMFKGASALNQSLNAWNTTAASNMESMFENAVLFNSDLDNWGTSNVSNMKGMFKNAAVFNGNITTWETQNVSDMSGMFEGAVAFNRDLSNWVTSQVTNMSNMFRGAAIFDQELNSWDVSNVTNFSGMLRNAALFKRDLNNWSTQNGINFSNMFNGASFFDGELSAWNTSAAQNMSAMFANTNSFNRDISSWDVAQVVDFSSMFQNALGFNRNLGSWDVSNAENLAQMFDNAPQFNADLSLWDVSNVELMNSMFENATAFNQNLGTWILNPQVQMSGLLNHSGLDCNNYSATLQGWYLNNPGIQGINLGAQNMTYNGIISSVRDELINNQGWSITGDAQVATNPYVLSPGEQFSAQLACYGEFTRIDDPSLRLVMLDPNGNNIDFNTVAVEALNDFLTPSNSEIVTVQSSGNGYYQISDGTNTFRVGSRLFKIEVPGNFTINGGVRVRLYYEQDDFSGMLNDVPPSGNIANYGWFKSSAGNFQNTIDEMDASPAQLPSAVVLVPVYGNENGAEYVEFLVENFSVFGMYAQTIDAPLPVTLTSFNANCHGETIQLNWTTASEFNASHYVVQSSRDGSVWTDLGEVNAAGTTNQNTNYSFETPNFGGLTYFRLVQVDLDGASEIFGPVSANCELENNSMTVYPNPTAGNFTVRIETKAAFENATLELIDNTGRIVLSRTLSIEAGTTTLPLESRDLQPGVYILSMRGEGEKFKPVQVVRI